MSRTWQSATQPKAAPIGAAGWARAVLRGAPLGLLVFGGLALLLVVRLVERPLCGQRRPVTPWITVGVCRGALRLIGLRRRVTGGPMPHEGALVANHASWLDVFVLNATGRLYFVAKAEVAGWAGIGWLARATGTLFIRRDRREAGDHTRLIAARLRAGHRILFFPEGTSTDGQRVERFNPTLFAGLIRVEMPGLHVQPVSVAYRAANGVDPRAYAWWGNMDFAPHLLRMLAMPRHGDVQVTFHPALPVGEATDRKALSAACERAVRDGHTDAIGGNAA